MFAAALAVTFALTADQQQKVLEEFKSFLAIPNVATDKENIGRNADAILVMFARRGIAAKPLRIEGAPPIIVADWLASKAKETIAFYAHYDGQPVDPAQWATPPWQPVIKDDRIYARSASDDKGTIMAMMAAIDAMNEQKTTPKVNIKFVFEGEEEQGSPHLQEYLQKFAKDLTADAWMLCDGPVHQSRKMQLYFGARGITDVEITTYGPLRPLHSGHYGNWAPNPIVSLTHLIDSMRDANARILIPGFYDDVTPLTAAERRALREIPNVDDDLKRELAFHRAEGPSLNEQILKPALNVRGISAGHVGAQASNAISTEAQASIDFRLVPKETPESVRDRVERFLTKNQWFIVHDTPDAATRLAHPNVVKLVWGAGYPPARTPIDSAIGQRVSKIVNTALGYPPILMPSLGGSIPMYLFQNGGRTPVIGIPIANHDNNQHAANENLRLQNLWDGIEVYAALFGSLD